MRRHKTVALVAAVVFGTAGLAACSSDDDKGSAAPAPTAPVTTPGLPKAEVPDPPSDTSVDAGFARDMKVHHQQAVEMAFIVRDATDNEQIRKFAYDIATTQLNQIGQMMGWLDLWGLTQTTTTPPMQWMSPEGMSAMSGHTMGPGEAMPTPGPDDPLMPGMATKAQLDELRSLTGVQAEVKFLQLMITHHLAGVQMAQDALNHGQTEVVKALAKGMVNAQTSEVSLMQAFLAERGA
ncbi:DUF305 domain-containing protein [Yinghuangia sp. ASG 101]|uniref:DUF305 domain-containing protein n=1 Tax=Yinghuangia sp. ASG 101 TaxID=2896848 RepID=UPI001E4291FD|nr:DUF305 domain-containing protein [Yinghuangia sp. ASG 101]UGQ15618.1 DUF305 domain-containing protein [Yinghuangia sp. ASG 101]